MSYPHRACPATFADHVDRVPALFQFSVDSNATLSHTSSCALESNVIDVVYMPQSESLIYSMDAVHQPFSTTVVASAAQQKSRPSVGAMHATELGLEKDCESIRSLVAMMQSCLDNQPCVSEDGESKGTSMRELIYSLENLRKRVSEDDDAGH